MEAKDQSRVLTSRDFWLQLAEADRQQDRIVQAVEAKQQQTDKMSFRQTA